MGFFQKYPVKRVVCLFLRFSFQNKSNFSLKIKIYPDNNIILPCYDNFTPSNVSFVYFHCILPCYMCRLFHFKKIPRQMCRLFLKKIKIYPSDPTLPCQMCRLFF